MKRITFLLICLIPFWYAVNAQNASTSTVDELLERLEVAGASQGPEPDDLFTEEERIVLRTHFMGLENEENILNKSVDPGTAYSVQLSGLCDKKGFGTFPIAGPYNLTIINPVSSTYYAGELDGSGRLFGWSIEGYTNHRVTLNEINVNTGEETEVGEVSIYQDFRQLPTGLAWNHAYNKMYAIATNSDETELYTVNLETAELTSIGKTGFPGGTWLAINNEGEAYALDNGLDVLFSINLETGQGTAIGPIGVNVVFGQDADFDPATGILYTVGYHGSGTNRLYSVNLETGAYTSHGPVNNDCAQMGLFAIYNTMVDVPNNPTKDFGFFPNPVNNHITLSSSENISSVSIYNIMGQKVVNSVVADSDSQIDVSLLKQGVYFLEVIINGRKDTYKFVKN
ncbi:MAG: T9SS type A sorting domain-containing protein [Mariniphaga sp.]|jgi:hypothetical protein|nr:T9SS type A sorting domain-containing protein [Mariniphaga sp.]